MTMRMTTRLKLTAAALLLAVSFASAPKLDAQGYSFAAPYPNIATPASGLTVTYGTGSIVVGGLVQSILTGTVSVTNTQTNCQAPAFASCNFIYWPGSGTALLNTTTYATAFAQGNVVLAYVTATGGNVVAVTPATLNVPPPSTSTYGYTNGSYWIPASGCVSSVSAGSTGTNGLTVSGASFTPVMQAQTDNTAVVHTHTYICNLAPPSRVGVTGRGVTLVDAVIYYGIQTTALDTQVAVLASGTMNGQIVFTKITYPASGASETPSTVTPVRADAGTLVINPVVGSFNVATTTAGSFFSATFTPATPFALQTDLVQYFLNVKLLNATTVAQITNVAGVQVHYTVVN